MECAFWITKNDSIGGAVIPVTFRKLSMKHSHQGYAVIGQLCKTEKAAGPGLLSEALVCRVFHNNFDHFTCLQLRALL